MIVFFSSCTAELGIVELLLQMISRELSVVDVMAVFRGETAHRGPGTDSHRRQLHAQFIDLPVQITMSNMDTVIAAV